MRSTRVMLLPAAIAVVVVLAASCAPTPGRTTWSTFPTSDQTLVVPTAGEIAGPLTIDGTELVDAQGRVVVLRGTNLVVKSDPWLAPTTSASTAATWPQTFDGDDFAELRRMGHNAVRLGVWYGELVPEVGVIDQEYLDRVDAAIAVFEENGIYVLLDFHQDVFNGMPDWTTTDAAAALDREAPALFSAIGWAAEYLSPRSLQQWKDLLGDAETSTTPGVTMWDALAEGVAAMAERFEGRVNLAGIEVLNEPFPGIDYVRCIAGGCPDVEARLGANYQKVIDAVRPVAPTMPLWLEPIISAPHYGDTTMAAPVGTGIGFAWHAYCSGTDGGTLEPVAPGEEARCNLMMQTAHNRAAAKGAEWGAPTMMTEFGASKNPLDVNLVTAEADDRVGSWLHWAYGYFPTQETDSALARVYPEATAGEPDALAFDRQTGRATYSFRSDGSGGETVLAIPSQHYPDGYDVAIMGASVVSAPDAAHLRVGAPVGSEVQLTITRRPV